MQPPYRGDVHDAARVLPEHAWQHLLNGVERAVEVNVKYPAPVFLADILKQALTGDTCVIDKQRHLAEAVSHGLDHLVNGLAVGNVGSERHGLAAVLDELLAKLLGLILPLDVIYAHGVTAVRESHGAGTAYAAR